MAKVGIIMGSDSDMAVMSKAAEVLDEFGVDYEMHIISAHREPDVLYKWAQECRENGTKVIIAGAGMAAALPGVVASQTIIPVIGVPISGSVLDGMDALMSIVQMPSGIPVATVAINGSKNAAYLALQIMAVKHEELKNALLDSRKAMETAAMEANNEVMARYS